MFEKASKQKLRFVTTVGTLTTEDLWDLPLTSHVGISLDNIAKELNRAIKADDEDSFVTKKTNSNTRLNLQFDIVKHIIEVKLEEAEASKNRKAKAEKKQKILSLIDDKENDALAAMSKEDLMKMLDE